MPVPCLAYPTIISDRKVYYLASCSSRSYLPLLLPFNHHLPLSIGLMLGGEAAVAVLASVRRAGALPATEHHSGSQSHTVGFISNLSADAFCGR